MKPKVLLLQGTLSLYNVPTYDIIAQSTNLTVAYTLKNECQEKMTFKTVKLDYIKFGGLFFIKNGFRKMCTQYDVVLFLSDLHYFSYCTIPFLPRKYKVIPWTIGVRASYTKRYDVTRKKDIIDMIYGKILSKSDAIIFYMKAPIEFWGNRINKNKVFIAHNTVAVLTNQLDINISKNRILFIGTLYKEKKIYELIDAYIEAKTQSNCNNFLSLDIIGKGDEYENIKTIIKEHDLSESVILHGPIYDEIKLSYYFSKSILCISPDQAGLSVLKSMGYGVPFVTRKDAITGGERLNIIDKENGLLYKTQDELVNIIFNANKNPENYIKMGVNAQKHYLSFATPKHMAQGVMDAITYVLK